MFSATSHEDTKDSQKCKEGFRIGMGEGVALDAEAQPPLKFCESF